MASRSTLLLILVLVVAVGAVAYLLLGEELGLGGIGGYGQNGADGDPEWAGLGDLDDPELAPAPGAMTPEEREALRTPPPADGPGFSRTRGVWGVVQDPRGNPVAEATIELGISKSGLRTYGIPDPPPIATTKTKADGSFLVGPAPEGILRIRAEAAGWAPTVKLVKRRGFRIDVILYKGGALEVRVKSREGDSVPEAVVIHQAGYVVSDATTDEEGKAFFPGLPTGQGTLVVSHAEHASVRQEGIAVAPGETEEHTVVLGQPIVVKGQVLDQTTERGIDGVRIAVRYPQMPWLEPEEGTRSDPDGRFEISTLAPLGQSIEVETSGAGYAPSRSWNAVTDSGDGTMSLVIRLSKGEFMVQGEVRDNFGQPVHGAKVTYIEQRAGQGGPETKTDRNGWFTLSAPPWAAKPGGSAQLVAVSATRGVGANYVRFPKEGEETPTTRIALSGVGAVRGRVTDTGGAPVEGALVSLQVDWSTTMQRMRQGGGGGAPAWMLANVLQSGSFARLDEITDTDGRFVLDQVPAAAYLLSASFGLETANASEPVNVTAGGTVERQITLGEGATIEGWVQDGNGQPVVGAYVTAWPLNTRNRNRSSISGRSQSDGAFVIHGASEAEYNLRAWAAGYESASQQRVLAGDTGITIVMKPQGWIEGIVYHQGRPLEGTFTVQAVRKRDQQPGAPASPMRWRGGGRSGTYSTDDGSFLLRNLRSGEYQISARTPEGLITAEPPSAVVTDGQGTSVRLTLVGGAEVRGLVLGDESGGPISGAHVTVSPVTGPDAPTTTSRGRSDAEGRFVARGLAAGRYVVLVYPPSGLAFHETLELAEGQRAELTLRERPPGQVRVTVRDAEGRPIEGATPRIVGESGMQVWPNWQLLRKEGVEFGRGTMRRLRQTDESGVNVRRHVSPGNYQVSASMRGYQRSEEVWVEVRPRQTTNVELVLKAAPQAEDGGSPPPPPPVVPFR